MVSGALPQTGAEQTKSGQAGPTTTVPFEVVRRAEFVFEPFLGSLIQLPEAGPLQAQNSEYFLPHSPVARTEVLRTEVLQPEASQVEVPQAEVLQAEVWRTEVWEAEVSQEAVLQAELLQAEVSQAEVGQDAAPEVASTVEMKATEKPAVSAVAETVEEDLRAEPSVDKVANASRLTPLVQEQWQIAEAKPRVRRETVSLAKRVGRWLWNEVPTLGGSRRRAERRVLPGLLAFYWSGGTPKPHEVVNISKTGFYMRTTELWSVETLVRMTLQRPRRSDRRKPDSVSVLARVVRIDEGGVGHEFVTTEALRAARSLDVMPSQGTNSKELDRFLEAG
jgi:hypothetical protein